MERNLLYTDQCVAELVSKEKEVIVLERKRFRQGFAIKRKQAPELADIANR